MATRSCESIGPSLRPGLGELVPKTRSSSSDGWDSIRPDSRTEAGYAERSATMRAETQFPPACAAAGANADRTVGPGVALRAWGRITGGGSDLHRHKNRGY